MIHRPIVCRKFVARESELTYLHDQRLLAGKSSGGVVLIAGDAGVGKSRLLREFCGSLATSRWKIGYGASLEHAQRPYGPILDVLDAWDRKPASLLPAATKREQFDAIAERLTRIAAKTALIGVVEDIHWADTGTLELLAFLATKIERRRVLMLASFRPHEYASDHPTSVAIEKISRAARSGRIDLAPFEDVALREFIDEALANHALPLETRRLVAQTSEGNPFFTEELLRVAIERTVHGSAEKTIPLPSSLRATLLESYHRLDAADRAVLAQAAVIGPAFELPLLAKTLERRPADLLTTLARARDHQLIEELSATKFTFRHALTRRAIYEGFLGAQTEALHRTIARALEDSVEAPALNELAYHWWAARDGVRSAEVNTRAGDAAASVHAHEDAIVLYERALDSQTLEPRARAKIVQKIADRYLALGLPERRYTTYMQAAVLYASVGDHDNEAQCSVLAVISAYTGGNFEAIETLHTLLARLPGDAEVARAYVEVGLAWLMASFSFPLEAMQHLSRVGERAMGVIDIAHRYHNVASWVAMTLGDSETFLREFPLWLEAARASNLVGAVASARLNGAACLATLGLHEQAIAQCLQSIELARGERNVLAEEAAFANLAIAYYQTGNILGARDALAALPAVPESAITRANASAIGTVVGAHLGDEALIDRWFERAGSAYLKFPEADTAAGCATVLVRRGKPDDARAALGRALPNCQRVRGNLRTLVTVARYGDVSDFDRARTLLATAADAPSDVPEKPALALFDAYVASRAGDRERAKSLARQAADGFERLRYPLLEAAAREVAHEFAEARAIFLRCGAVWDARRLLGNGGVRDSTTDAQEAPSQSSEAGLSPREFEIASLATRGKSNLEIAQLLAISHKTVEKHLSSVYQKLGASSRVQLATRLAVRGGE